MKFLLSYAYTRRWLKKRETFLATARQYGGFDHYIIRDKLDIDPQFVEQNKRIFDSKRGGGLYLWKPYIILQALKSINYDDYLFYCDIGAIFRPCSTPLIEQLISVNQDVICFPNNLDNLFSSETINQKSKTKSIFRRSKEDFLEKYWTKRDLFLKMNCDKEEYAGSVQFMGGRVFLHKCKKAVSFVEEWLNIAQNYHLISDAPNKEGLANYEGFVEHRHDQSIFSLLCKRYNIYAYKNALGEYITRDNSRNEVLSPMVEMDLNLELIGKLTVKQDRIYDELQKEIKRLRERLTKRNKEIGLLKDRFQKIKMNRWLCFGQLSRKQKLWKMVKFVSKKIGIYQIYSILAKKIKH